MRTIDDEKSRLVCFVRGQSSGVRIMKTSFHSLLVVVVVVVLWLLLSLLLLPPLPPLLSLFKTFAQIGKACMLTQPWL